MVAAEARTGPGNTFYRPIKRERVTDRIREAASYPVTLIVAPAGYGKTVALRHYLEEAKSSVVYCDLRSSETGLLGFIRGLARAFSSVAPDISKTVHSAFESSRTSPTCVDDLAQWIHEHIARYRGLVAIDDLHISQSDSRVDDLLYLLVDLTKERVHWLLSSRGVGTLPVASWMAYGDMHAIVDESDLRMSLEEAQEVAAEVTPDASCSDIERLLRGTDSWPAAINFALRSRRGLQTFSHASPENRTLLYDFLAEEVYNLLTPQSRTLLHFCSILPVIDVDVLSRADFDRPEASLRDLQSRIGFIWSAGKGVYRCHDLFRDFLNHQLELQGHTAKRALQERAISAVEAAGDIPSALRLSTSAASKESILRLLRSRCFDLLGQAHSDAVSAALDCFDASEQGCDATLTGLAGLRELEAGNSQQGELLMGRAIGLARDAELAAELRIRLGESLFQGRRDLTSVLEPVYSDTAISIDRRMRALSLLGPYYAFKGRIDEARSSLNVLKDFAPVCGEPGLRARLYQRAGIIAVEIGAPAAEQKLLFEKALEVSEQAGIYTVAAAAYGGLMTVSRYNDDDTAYALRMSRLAVRSAQRSGARSSLQLALFQAMEIQSWAGDFAKLEDALRQISFAAAGDNRFRSFRSVYEATLLGWKGNYRGAYDTVKALDVSGHFHFDKWFDGARNAIFAFGCGMREEAIALTSAVMRSVRVSESSSRMERLAAAAAIALCAVVDVLAGRPESAHRKLGKIRVDGDRRILAMQNYVAALSEAASGANSPSLWNALEEARDAGVAGIIMLFQPLIERLDMGDSAVPLLTRAEREVVRAFADGLSPKEIAAKSNRSVHTVRTLGQRAMEKLGCSNRQQAIAVAMRRGLLGEAARAADGATSDD